MRDPLPEPRPSGSGPPVVPAERFAWLPHDWLTLLGGACGMMTMPTAAVFEDLAQGRTPDLFRSPVTLPAVMAAAVVVGWLPGAYGAAIALRARAFREASWPDGLTRAAGAFCGAGVAVWALTLGGTLLFDPDALLGSA